MKVLEDEGLAMVQVPHRESSSDIPPPKDLVQEVYGQGDLDWCLHIYYNQCQSDPLTQIIGGTYRSGAKMCCHRCSS